MVKKIGILVGSLRAGSFTKIVARKFADLLPEGYQAELVEIGDLPLYNEDLETEGNVPAAWTKFRSQVREMEGIYFFTPEYNRSVPAVLKNALDVGSRPYGQSVWDGKPALVVSVSPGAISGFGANHHLRQSLVFLNMPTLQQPEAYIGNITNLIDDDGEIMAETVDFFRTITENYLDFFEKLT